VSAEVTNYRPFYILGEVNRPDQYQYSSGLTVMNAVAAAGGFTYRANRRDVFIRSAGENTERKVTLTTTTQVRPGDTIRIGERIF
ncbi:MAG: SLBB domain-containing protein, partial [Pseudomonadota bacterium]